MSTLFRCAALVLVTLMGAGVASADEFVGTTPCGAIAREFIGISRTEMCDKITWQLSVLPQAETKTYKLKVTYGLQEPSALGFVNGGTTATLRGTLNVRKGTRSDENAVVYEIKHPESEATLRFVRLNDNLIHLMDGDQRLVIGNEFWSYTLNRKGVGGNR